MKLKTSQSSAFSIIEVLIGIFIFSLGIASIYMVIASTLNLNSYNKNYIIASALASEQVELLKNIRDNNYATLHAWDWIPNNISDSDERYKQTFQPKDTKPVYYTTENTFQNSDLSINFEEINDFGEGKGELNGKMLSYQLCFDAKMRYVICGNHENKTQFYKYLKIEKLDNRTDAILVSSKVIWNIRGYHETEIKTILTDWKRL